MTKDEFIVMIQEYARKEMIAQQFKANEAHERMQQGAAEAIGEYWAHVGAANEAEKFFNVIVQSYIQDHTEAMK